METGRSGPSPPFGGKLVSDEERFAAIFQGLSRAQGRHTPSEVTEGVKAEGKSIVIKASPTIDHFTRHLSGELHLGIIPINDESMCRWGCIDVDQYDLDLDELVNRVTRTGLPLFLCRSKSGGAHLLLFTREWVPAVAMQSKLLEIAESMGYPPGIEVFPKQTTMTEDRVGNWLNLPYQGGDATVRYWLPADHKPASLSRFLVEVEAKAISLEELEGLWPVPVDAPRGEGEFDDGPPCLEALYQLKITGNRNVGLSNVLTYLNKKMWRCLMKTSNVSIKRCVPNRSPSPKSRRLLIALSTENIPTSARSVLWWSNVPRECVFGEPTALALDPTPPFLISLASGAKWETLFGRPAISCR